MREHKCGFLSLNNVLKPNFKIMFFGVFFLFHFSVSFHKIERCTTNMKQLIAKSFVAVLTPSFLLVTQGSFILLASVTTIRGVF